MPRPPGLSLTVTIPATRAVASTPAGTFIGRSGNRNSTAVASHARPVTTTIGAAIRAAMTSATTPASSQSSTGSDANSRAASHATCRVVRPSSRAKIGQQERYRTRTRSPPCMEAYFAESTRTEARRPTDVRRGMSTSRNRRLYQPPVGSFSAWISSRLPVTVPVTVSPCVSSQSDAPTSGTTSSER